VKFQWSKLLAPGIALGLGLVLAPAAGAEPPAMVQQEVSYLLAYIGKSGCEFNRNGTWNDATAAEAHAREKYDYLAAMGWIDTTKDFIDKAASASSLSGQSYAIRCGDGTVVPSGRWLSEELSRYRALHDSSVRKGDSR
jgi:hypothetical protein